MAEPDPLMTPWKPGDPMLERRLNFTFSMPPLFCIGMQLPTNYVETFLGELQAAMDGVKGGAHALVTISVEVKPHTVMLGTEEP